MTTHTEATADAAVATTLSLLDDIFGGVEPRDFAVRLWNGACWGPGPGRPARFTLVLRHPGALRRAFLHPTELNLAECYIFDDFDVEGDVEALVPVARRLIERDLSLWDKLRIGKRLLSLPAAHGPEGDGDGVPRAELSGRRHSLARDRAAVTFHYDLSNEFYRRWLDRNMIYSCAYFADADEELEAAQERKLDFLCRKLRLCPGERLLDIGCGWGGLIRHAARAYGVEALGITLSQPQADLANERIREAGLADRCRAEVSDYREREEAEGFDKIVSVGMVEHVGRERLDEYFRTAHRLLKPGGAFLNHGIGELCQRPVKKEKGFVRTYVFPDSDLPPIPDIFAAAERAGFEGRDLENLREHYALTLRHWVARLEASREAAIREVGERTYRVWRLYMAGCAAWFDAGFISVYQSLFVRQTARGGSNVPLTRFDWYAPAAIDTATA